MKNYKNLFPIFKNNPDLHYLDSAATSLKPQVVLDKMMDYYINYSANIHRGLYPISERATEEYEKVREKTAKFIGAKKSGEIIFTSGATDSINLVANGWGENNLKEGDEIVVSIAEHHSNFVPWQELAKKRKLVFQISDLSFSEKITKNTKLLAINHVSNVLGTINDIKSIIKKARTINPDICVVVDGAQAVAHISVNVTDLDCDFYCFSGHKMYGPTGVGVLYGKVDRLVQMNLVRFGGGMIKTVDLYNSTWADIPEKFEAGTPPIGEVIGLGVAIDFINEIGMENIMVHEKELIEYLFGKLKDIKWINILGLQNLAKLSERIGVVSMYSNDKRVGTSHDMADILGRKFNVAVRAGHHCAMPLHTKFGIETGTVRASLGIYNDKNDIDELIKGLKHFYKIFNS
ncbi:cysteine desulfurase [Candidatus Shapirobacteria bacterium CG10_big_fil_rev_8_21_14_0_10_36_6]|uniref:Cysteine desulfurase n=1 Tax=Candidatus Shapirobacteria bacterium CG10_big_fil_rev_8_21_14_0_10_36_6 TaxID=1974886 RepID=A0A2M8L2L8_9BACT|nr:MAG: cysteine desulfurase [Candidatus Shapirobacteria bacterium CG10_big_fil_rev_8_21_14_0_10_36_6]